MSVLDSFVDEMLQSEVSKRVLIEKLTRGLENVKPPKFTIPPAKYTFESNLHGFIYDYQQKRVTIAYKVTHSIYPDMTVSFQTFRVILEGLAVCIRMQKW
jgi:hypothetical protein